MRNEIFFVLDPIEEASRRYLPTIEKVRYAYGERYAIRFLGICSDTEGSEAVVKAVCVVREILGEESAWHYLYTLIDAYEKDAIDITQPRLLFGFYTRLFGDSARFAFLYHSERAEKLLIRDKERAKAMGILQAPATAIVDEDGHLVAFKDAATLETLRNYFDTK